MCSIAKGGHEQVAHERFRAPSRWMVGSPVRCAEVDRPATRRAIRGMPRVPSLQSQVVR